MSIKKKYKKYIIDYGYINGIIKCTQFYIVRISLLMKCVIASNFVKPQFNRIAFMSMPDYSDNAKCLSDYIIDNYSDKYEILWFVNEPEKYEKEASKFSIKFCSSRQKGNNHSWKTIKTAYSAGIVFYTHSFPIRIRSRHNQLIINLWHGCGYKAFEGEKKNSLLFDYVLVPGNVFVDTKAQFFNVSRDKILPIGYPRYDRLLRESECANYYVNQLKAGMDKLIMWMPTYRKTTNNYYPEGKILRDFDLPILLSEEQVDRLNDLCAENSIMLCIKRHPMQIKYSCEEKDYSNISFIDNDCLTKNSVELYSLLHYTDALVSDYSSVAIDYLLLQKPIAFALDDFEEYKATRGFVFDNPLKYMPGHHLINLEDFSLFICAIAKEEDKYAAMRMEIMPEVHNSCKNYCKRVWESVDDMRQLWKKEQEHRKQ